MKKGLDITGVQKGTLTAVKKTEMSKNHKIIWEFKCNCGKPDCPKTVYMLRGNFTRIAYQNPTCKTRGTMWIAKLRKNRDKPQKNNTSGTNGISFDKRTMKWLVRFNINGRVLVKWYEFFEDALNQKRTWRKEYANYWN